MGFRSAQKMSAFGEVKLGSFIKIMSSNSQ